MFLRWWPQQNSNELVGLDIGADSIKLLQINSTKTPAIVENFCIATTPAGALNKEKIVDPSSIANTLRNMYRECNVKTKDVAIAISRSSAIIKNITIDNRLTQDEIESRAWIEANRHFPDLVGDIYLDFSILGPSAQDSSQLDVILVACRKEQITPYLEICKLAGLNLKIVDINSYSLERVLQVIGKSIPEKNNLALFNLNLAISTLIVTQGSNLIYAHDQTYDGERLIKQVNDYSAALAGTPAVDDEKYLELLKEILSAHMRHTMHFFFSSRPNINIDCLILAGDCASIPHLASFIKKETGIETQVANPFISFLIGPDVNESRLRQNTPALALCSGLALSPIEYANKRT